MRELADRIRAVVHAPGRVVVRPSADPEYLTDNPQRRCPDVTKLRALGGSMPCVSLDEGLARYVRWLEAQDGPGDARPTAEGS